MDTLILFTALLVKHFICDYPMQMFPWMYENKGIFPHPGGFVHALIHSIGTAIVLSIFVDFLTWQDFVLLCFVFEGSLHYAIDYTKVNLCKKYRLKPTTSDLYWVLLGFDQLLHHLTYAAIALAVLKRF